MEKLKNEYPFNYKKGIIEIRENKVVLQHSTVGHFCGYVALKKSKLPRNWHGGDYDADALQYLQIHGGLTYCHAYDDYVVYGFDCAHAGDEANPKLKDINYIFELVDQMEQQILEYAKRHEEWRVARREDKMRIMDEIRKTAKLKLELGFGALIGALGGGSEFND